VSVVRKTAVTGVPLRVTKSHPVPMWKTEYLTKPSQVPLKDVIERMVAPGETLWVVDETVVHRGGDDYVFVLSPGGAGWMYEGHLTERA